MSEEKKELALKSIAGAPDVVYPWPLTVGKGNCRGAEDEHDQVRALIYFPVLICIFSPRLWKYWILFGGCVKINLNSRI